MKFPGLVAALALVFFFSCTNKDDTNLTPPVTAIEFTIPPDSVKVDPYGYTPLSALVGFSTEKMGSTVLIVKGLHGAHSDVVHRFNDAGLYHSIPVIGMYANFANTVLLRVVDSNGDTLARSTVMITTKSLPADMPTSITALPFDPLQVEPGLILVSNFSTRGIAGRPTIPFLMDDYGDIRWVLDYSSYPELSTLAYDDGISRLRNGNFFFGDHTTNKIFEVDLLGKIWNTWSMPGYEFHHEASEKPDGNFLVSVNKIGAATIEDYIIEIARNDGSIIKEWDLKQSLDQQRTALTTNANDWIHVNAVTYDSTDNTIVVSGRTQGVIKLDYDNRAKWILASHLDWGTNGRGEDLQPFLLQPLDASGNPITDTAVLNGWTTAPDFEWPWYQHSNVQMPNGSWLLFDNGTARTPYPTDGTDIWNAAPGKYSRAVEYYIDEANMTIQQRWTYGKERGVATYSSIISNVQFLPEKNHVLFGPGFNVANEGGFGGKVVEIDYNSKQVVSEISINTANKFGFHRAKKMSAYPSNL